MRRTVSFLLSLSLALALFVPPLFAAGGKPDFEKVDNALAQGYTAVQNQQDAQALTHFSEAGKLARSGGDWQGMLDAGYGLAAMGNAAEAHPLFSDAVQAARKEGNPAGLIAAAYALGSLPRESNALAEAESALDAAMGIVREARDPQGATTLAKAYRDLGFAAKSGQAQGLASELAAATGEAADTRVVKDPPPGWSPVGESIKGPKKVPVEVQQLNRQSADRDIAAKMDYIKHSEQLEQQEKERRTRLAEAYMYYNGYYGYPGGWFGINDFGLFGFGSHQITVVQRRRWASTQLSYFSPHGGFLIRVDRGRRHHWWD